MGDDAVDALLAEIALGFRRVRALRSENYYARELLTAL
jgi:hypothetical protein